MQKIVSDPIYYIYYRVLMHRGFMHGFESREMLGCEQKSEGKVNQ